MPTVAADSGYVVILHGIKRTSRHMAKLAVRLQDAGYEPLNIDYPSTTRNMSELTDWLHNEIEKLTPQDRPVNFVGYSMGALMVRALINRYRPAKLGRVVQLAPPNQGSEVADFLSRFRLYKWLYGTPGLELGTNNKEIKELLGDVDYELGVIAGTRSIDPVSTLFLLPGRDDGKVSLESTKVKGMADHIVLPATHTWFPQNARVIAQTIYFLRTGKFRRDSA